MKKILSAITIISFLSISLNPLLASDDIQLNPDHSPSESCSEQCAELAQERCESRKAEESFVGANICFTSSYASCLTSCMIPVIDLDDILTSD